MVRYYFNGSEFDYTKAKIVHSDSAFTNHMYSRVYDAKGRRVGLFTTSNFYRIDGAMKDVTTESMLRVPIGKFGLHVNFSTDTEYIRHPVKVVPHYISGFNRKVVITISPPIDPFIPRTIDIE
jgi:hypothetical protein